MISNSKWHYLIVFWCTALVGPNLEGNAAQAGGRNPDAAAVAHDKKYVLDFSGSQGRGVPGGNFDNFAFTLDEQNPVRKMSFQSGKQSSNLIATYDYADCTKGQEALLEKPLNGLARGTPIWVDYVDIEMIPLSQPRVTWSGGVCYGYRNSSGAWHWHLATTPLRYDSATGLVRARVWVKQNDVDALKLVFDYSVPRQAVRSVIITTQYPTKK